MGLLRRKGWLLFCGGGRYRKIKKVFMKWHLNWDSKGEQHFERWNIGKEL